MKLSEAAVVHRNVPPDWYCQGIKRNLGQRFWHHRRFTEIGKLIEPTGGKILDIGSADGTFTKIILDRSRASFVIGIDALSSSVAYAKKRFARNKRLRFRVAEAEKLPFKDNEFDAVFALEVLEHLFVPEKALREVKRVLKKEGYAIFLVPTESIPFKIIWFFWENTWGWIWKGTHVQKFANGELVKIIKKVGFRISTDKKFLLGMLKAIKAKKDDK